MESESAAGWRRYERLVWGLALSALMAAAGAGLLWRGMVAASDVWLDLGNLRHAHSHVMLVGWATPALMWWIMRALGARGQRVDWRGLAALIGLLWISALASLPTFALWGYGAAPIGQARVPLSIIASTINMLGWYVFVWLYVRARRGAAADSARWCWDVAVAALAMATLGGWARGALMALKVDAPALAAVSVHTLVDLCAEGWLTMGVAGLWVARAGVVIPTWARRALIVGIWTSCLLAPAPGVLPGWLRAGAAPAGVALGLTWAALAGWLWRERARLPRTLWGPVGALLVKGLMLIANAWPLIASWGHVTGLRIVYIHVSLVAVVTAGLIEQATRADDVRTAWVTQGAVWLMLGSFALQSLPYGWVRWAGFGGGLLAASILLGRGVALGTELERPPAHMEPGL